jgi:CRP-like cAMP-binding protein
MKPHLEIFKYSRNEHICKADEPLEYLFFFVEGKAKVYSPLSNGKSLLLCFYEPFKVIGDVEFIKLERANSNVQVIEETYCVAIHFDVIRKYLLEDSKFLKYMCNCLGEKLIRLSKYSSINLLYPLENRLSSYILGVTTVGEVKGESSIVFEGNLSEVSELLGTSYRHLLRTLNNLCSQGGIKKLNSGYEIVDINKLDELAGDLYE